MTAPATEPEFRASRDWFVIWNPAAGNARERQWRRFARALQRVGLRVEVARTCGPGDAGRLASRAALAGSRQIMVAGGDGSAHEVVNGLMESVLMAASDTAHSAAAGDPPLLVPVPLGTGNDWARTLGLPRDPQRYAETIARRHEVFRHDVGRMRFDAAPAVSRWFINVAGAGFDADVIAALPPSVPSRFTYLWEALRRLGRYRSPEFRLSLADGTTTQGRYLLAFVANGQYCGHAMRVAPSARCDDGLLDLVTIDEIGLVRALPKLARLYRGALLDDPVVAHRTAPGVRIEATPPAPVEADGQLVGRTPVAFELEPGALRSMRASRS